MDISIFGLGYVGCVGIGCLASQGHKMVGVDVSAEKVDLINSGKPTIIEQGVADLIRQGSVDGKITATTDYREAVCNTDISFLCVGTPSGKDGHLNLNYIIETARQIGSALKEKEAFHIVVIRSTVFPGTNERITNIIEQESGKKAGEGFAVVSNPEFLREGTAVHDFLNPPLTVLGGTCQRALDMMRELYCFSKAPVEVVSIGVAEMIKYVNNTYHALKVTFANEVGDVCKKIGVDSHELMRIFCMDTELNISPYYFKPGFAYGGSCLPKDLKGLQTLAHDVNVTAPVLDAIDKSNEAHIREAYNMIASTNAQRIGVLGLSFKAGTDDMRNSPIVTIVKQLLDDGCEVRIYDRNVMASQLLGANKKAIQEKLPGFDNMLCPNLADVLEWADALVVTNKAPEFRSLTVAEGKPIIDLVRIKELENNSGYQGICW